MAHGARAHRWRRPGIFVAMLAGAWFFWSGATELFVSGMELTQRLARGPSAATFILWRGRADTLLLAVTVCLVLLGACYAVAIRAGWLDRDQQGDQERAMD